MKLPTREQIENWTTWLDDAIGDEDGDDVGHELLCWLEDEVLSNLADHLHSPANTSHPRCFTGPVSSIQNHAAHRGIRYVETCRCGASRSVNSNGVHTESGPWE